MPCTASPSTPPTPLNYAAQNEATYTKLAAEAQPIATFQHGGTPWRRNADALRQNVEVPGSRWRLLESKPRGTVPAAAFATHDAAASSRKAPPGHAPGAQQAGREEDQGSSSKGRGARCVAIKTDANPPRKGAFGGKNAPVAEPAACSRKPHSCPSPGTWEENPFQSLGDGVVWLAKGSPPLPENSQSFFTLQSKTESFFKNTHKRTRTHTHTHTPTVLVSRQHFSLETAPLARRRRG